MTPGDRILPKESYRLHGVCRSAAVYGNVNDEAGEDAGCRSYVSLKESNVLLLVLMGGVLVPLYFAWKLRQRTYLIAVLGARFSGKTTLLNAWRGDWLGDEADPGRTLVTRHVSGTKLTVEGLRLTFAQRVDLSGALGAWPTWESAAKESRYVLYLVDVRVFTGQRGYDIPTRDRLMDDVGQIARWLKEGGVELCLLTVTHTDQDRRYEALGPDAYREKVLEDVDQLVLRLGGTQKVHVVIGSQKTERSAQALTTALMAEIVSWEKDKRRK